MEEPQKKLVSWAGDPFRYLSNFLREAGDFQELVSHGFISANHYALAEEIIQSLEKLIHEPEGKTLEISADKQEHLENLRKMANKAKGELELGIPMLSAFLTVGCWSALEAAITDFIVAWLCNVPSAIQREQFNKIRLPVTEYEFSQREDRMRKILEEIKRSTNSSLRQGADQFECLLRSIGLDGPVADELRRTIFEMSQIRNVIVHRASNIDKRLADSCPWLNLRAGEKLRLKFEDSARYATAAGDYAITVIRRIQRHDFALTKQQDA